MQSNVVQESRAHQFCACSGAQSDTLRSDAVAYAQVQARSNRRGLRSLRFAPRLGPESRDSSVVLLVDELLEKPAERYQANKED
jgi:hypothetical protein